MIKRHGTRGSRDAVVETSPFRDEEWERRLRDSPSQAGLKQREFLRRGTLPELALLILPASTKRGRLTMRKEQRQDSVKTTSRLGDRFERLLAIFRSL